MARLVRRCAPLVLLLSTVSCDGNDRSAPQETPVSANASDRAPVSNEISTEAAAAQFTAGDEGLAGYERLSGAELRSLLVGRFLRNGGPAGPLETERFYPNGEVLILQEFGSRRSRFVIKGDAFCIHMQGSMGWRCRRIYRDRSKSLFQLFASSHNELFPIRVTE